MRYLVVAILLFALPGVVKANGTSSAKATAPAEAPAPQLGTLNFGGNWMSPPFTIEYRHRQPVINGFTLEPEPQPIIVPATNEAAALSAACNIGSAVKEEGRQKKWDNQRILTEWQARARALPHIASVVVAGDQLSITATNGITIVECLTPNRPHDPIDPAVLDSQDVQMVEQALKAGALVFILPDAVLTFKASDAAAMRTTADKARRNAPLTVKENRAIDPVKKYLRRPLRLIPIK